MTGVFILVAFLIAARLGLTAYEAYCLANRKEDEGPRLLPFYFDEGEPEFLEFPRKDDAR